MRNYINQFYNEGLATTFYLKPMKFINKVIKSRKACRIIGVLLKILYTIFMFILAWYIFWNRYPL